MSDNKKQRVSKKTLMLHDLGEDITVVVPKLKYEKMESLYDKYLKGREYHREYQRNKKQNIENPICNE